MKRTLLLLGALLLSQPAAAHPDWWVGKGGGGSGVGGGMDDLIDDTTPQLGGNLDGQNFNITTGGDVFVDDLTVDVLTYNSAVSSCTGTGCGLQLPNISTVPDPADSGTIRFYKWDALGAAVYDDGVGGHNADAGGFEGLVMLADGNGATPRSIPVALDTDGSYLGGTNVLISTGSVVSGVTLMAVEAGADAARGVQFGLESGTPPASASNTLRLTNFGGVMAAADSSTAAESDLRVFPWVKNFSITDNSIVRWDSDGSVQLQKTAGFTADDSGNVTAVSFVSPAAAGQLDVGLTSAAAGSSIRLQEDTDAAGDFGVVISAGNLTYTADVPIAAGRIARAANAANQNPSPVIGVVSNGTTKSTGEEACSLAYAEANGPVAACVVGSAKKFGTTVPADDTVDLIACSDEVDSGVYFEVACIVD